MIINFQGTTPITANPGDAGNDLFAYARKKGKRYIEYYTNTRVSIPEGYVGLLCPRSSISNYDLIMANSLGVIDSGFRGEIRVRFKVIPNIWNLFGLNPKIYKIDDKIAQLIIVPYENIDWVSNDLNQTIRGEQGFGSSNY